MLIIGIAISANLSYKIQKFSRNPNSKEPTIFVGLIIIIATIFTIVFIPLPISMQAPSGESVKAEIKKEYGMYLLTENAILEPKRFYDVVDSEGDELFCAIEEKSNPSGTMNLADRIFGDEPATNSYDLICAGETPPKK